LGRHLKTVREQSRRSLAEVSGAVEIEEQQLKLIESGLKRPEEEVMLLLISYFNMADQEALHLWEMAQYDTNLDEHLQLETDDNNLPNMLSKPMIMLLSMDVRTMYSDGVEVSWNESGLTLNFTQAHNPGASKKKQPTLSVAKVGMSYRQAEKVLECLQRALLHAKYSGSTKLLPPPSAQ
jgi:hypothetical protein